MPTYQQVQMQIKKLEGQAALLYQKEVDTIITQIQMQMSALSNGV